MNYYKRHIGDYHKKAGRLSMLEHGAYTLLLDACYDREKFPTKEEAIDWCWARNPEEIAAVEFVLSKFFTLSDGKYVQTTISENIAAYHENALKNKQIAIEREEAKRLKREQSVHGQARSVHESPPNHKPLTTNQEPLTNKKENNIVQQSNDCQTIFDYWCQVMKKSGNAKLTAERKKVIQARIKEGYSVEHIKQAIDGCARSDFHMARDGKNTTVYDDLTLICRSGSQLEKFALNVGAGSTTALILNGYQEFMG